ncbi:hypothetical protein D9M68_896800 [compost metagenome]
MNNQSVTLQNTQGFPQGRPTDAKLSGHVLLSEYRARRIDARIDSLAKCLCNFIQQTGLTAPFKSRQ